MTTFTKPQYAKSQSELIQYLNISVHQFKATIPSINLLSIGVIYRNVYLLGIHFPRDQVLCAMALLAFFNTYVYIGYMGQICIRAASIYYNNSCI